MTKELHQAIGQQVIALEAEALRQLGEMINGGFADAVEEILACKQRIVVSGMGKSGHIARKIAATLAATGTPAHFVHAAEAAHGDAGMVMPGDVLLIFSNSGDTVELQPLYSHAQRVGVRVIGVCRNRDSLLMRRADIGLVLPQVPEACTASMAPTTSSTMMLALGDALAVAAMRARGLSEDDIRALHPGGDIGRRNSMVADVMHSGDRLPLVAVDTPMPQVLITMTEKRLGMTGVVDADGDLVGVITDGDLRRQLTNFATGTVGSVMTPAPKIIEQSASVDDALEMMRTNRITVLFVVASTESRRPIGAVQIYDIAATPPWGR
ncbi:KpsF/GutQ family sugar-phosphate isomerase [Sandarakinorhabdus sp.]|uniref:KpsF/GutQ family sugar-phosphate isomerase n=1 Tax=Sandarakinorhabdus sp. TaxID=1916663 RepID=UPI00286E8A58|nr:KpsF/GutQ family sugar-phosphate isomerase [Sandarakinorhabdus sp.]